MLYKSVRSFRISCNICDIVSLKMIALCSKCATSRHIGSISTVFSYLNLQTPRGLFLVRPRFLQKNQNESGPLPRTKFFLQKKAGSLDDEV